MKKLLKALLILLLVIVLAAGGLLGFLSVTEYKPEPVEQLSLLGADGQPLPAALREGQPLSILSWNIGYCALGAECDFFMDGGSSDPADKPTVERYLGEIRAQLALGDYDMVILQEVDSDSSRSYGIDESAPLSIGQSLYALNYSCPFVPVPWPPMGKVHSGLLTSSEYRIESAQRVALPCPFSWPLRTANLKRCLLVSRLPVEGGDRQLVLVNLHLEAYDDGEGKTAQTRQLMELLEKEYAAGNYVIAGGDFNQTFPGALDAFPMLSPELWTPGTLEEASLPEGFSYVYDLDVPSCRLLNQPYDPSDTANTQYYVIDGFIVSPNVTVDAAETLDLGFADSDHNPVHLRVTLG